MNDSPHSSCRRTRDRLPLLLDDDHGLDPAEVRSIHLHLADCLPCRSRLEQLRSAVSALWSVRGLPNSNFRPLWSDLEPRLPQDVRRIPSRWARPTILGLSAAAAVLIAVWATPPLNTNRDVAPPPHFKVDSAAPAVVSHPPVRIETKTEKLPNGSTAPAVERGPGELAVQDSSTSAEPADALDPPAPGKSSDSEAAAALSR